MALISCRECGNQVSTEAPVCPKCGAPVARQPVGRPMPERKPTNPWMIIGWIIVLLLLLPLATCVMVIGGGAMGEYNREIERRQGG